MTKFLSRGEILRLHGMLLELYGGAPGVREESLLDSALGQPEASFDGAYLHVDVVEMAAAYAFHLAQNHPFVDGNKRTALATMLVFLEINGHSLRVPQEDLYVMMISLASGRLSKSGLTAWLRERVVSLPT